MSLQIIIVFSIGIIIIIEGVERVVGEWWLLSMLMMMLEYRSHSLYNMIHPQPCDPPPEGFVLSSLLLYSMCSYTGMITIDQDNIIVVIIATRSK